MSTTKKQKARAIPVRHPHCGMLKRDLLKQGIEVQTVSYNRSGVPVHAGVHWIPEISARWLYYLETKWARWRKWYDNLPENRRNTYRAKVDLRVDYKVFSTRVHPIDDPHAGLWLVIPTGF